MSSGGKSSIRVLLVDPQTIVRAGLRLLIESWPGLKVIGEAGTPVEAHVIATREKPQIILLDLDLGRAGSALDCIPDLQMASGGGRIIVLTAVHDSDAHHRAILLGAMGLVLKEEAPEDLRRAILKVHSGEIWLNRKLATGIVAKMSQPNLWDKKNHASPGITLLTAREREVFNLVSAGLKNKDIANRLFISETTVRHHLTTIFSKLEVTSRFELIIFAYRQKLVAPPEARAKSAGRYE
jgi:two-component system, NarL family, nitrate/nitrite response regulator NarL